MPCGMVVVNLNVAVGMILSMRISPLTISIFRAILGLCSSFRCEDIEKVLVLLQLSFV